MPVFPLSLSVLTFSPLNSGPNSTGLGSLNFIGLDCTLDWTLAAFFLFCLFWTHRTDPTLSSRMRSLNWSNPGSAVASLPPSLLQTSQRLPLKVTTANAHTNTSLLVFGLRVRYSSLSDYLVRVHLSLGRPHYVTRKQDRDRIRIGIIVARPGLRWLPFRDGTNSISDHSADYTPLRTTELSTNDKLKNIGKWDTTPYPTSGQDHQIGGTNKNRRGERGVGVQNT